MQTSGRADQANQPLGDPEDRYRTLAENSPLLVWTVRAGGHVTYFNRRWLEYTGRSLEEGHGHGWEQALHPDDVQRFVALRGQAPSDGPFEVEGRFRRHDGVYRWHAAHLVPIEYVDGVPVSWLGTALDIDDRYRAAEQLRLSEERSRLAEQAARFGTWQWDMAETVIWSEAMEEIYGFAPGTFPGTFDAFLARVHPDDRQPTIDRVSAALASGAELDFEHRIVLGDGRIRWLNGRGKLIRDEAGKPVRMVGIGLDVTEAKEAQRLLRETQQREHLLAEITAHLLTTLEPPELLAQIARDCVPVMADVCSIGLFDGGTRTQRFETAGIDESEAADAGRIHLRQWKAAPGISDTIDDRMRQRQPLLVPDCDAPWIDACAPDDDQRAAARGIGACSLMCLPLVARGDAIGMVTFAMTRSRRQFSAQDAALASEIVGRASTAVDNARLLSELRETAIRLEQANAAKDDFLGLVSHELKTPITTILGNADVLSRSFDRIDPEARTAALEDVRNEAERLNRIIENLLVLARLEQGQGPEFEPLNLPKLIERVGAAHRRNFPHRTIQIGSARPAEFAMGSELYIEQVLGNLLSNAEKYSPPDGRISIDVRACGDAIEVSVRDEGAGLAEDERERIFTPFYRSPRTRGQAQGVGIGLAVCRRLMEVQGGEIHARPSKRGAEFVLRLPILAEYGSNGT